MNKKRVRDRAAALAILSAMGCLLLFPRGAAEAARGGLAVCTGTLIPSLFPFLVLSGVLTRTGLAAYLGRPFDTWMKKLFWLPGSCAGALVVGLTAGYPVGAKTAVDLYRQGACTAAQAKRLLCFCSNAGPAFVLSMVGVGIFGSARVGVWLLLCQTLASLMWGTVLGLFARRREPMKGAAVRADLPVSLRQAPAAVGDAAVSMLRVCGFAVFFAVMLRMLQNSGLITWLAQGLLTCGVPPAVARGLTDGFWEVTAGLLALGSGQELTAPAVAAAGLLLAWSGMSVHFQVMAYLGEAGLPCGAYLAGKGICAGLTAALVYVLARWRLLEIQVPVFAGDSLPLWRSSLTLTMAVCGGLIGGILMASKKPTKAKRASCIFGHHGV